MVVIEDEEFTELINLGDKYKDFRTGIRFVPKKNKFKDK